MRYLLRPLTASMPCQRAHDVDDAGIAMLASRRLSCRMRRGRLDGVVAIVAARRVSSPLLLRLQ